MQQDLATTDLSSSTEKPDILTTLAAQAGVTSIVGAGGKTTLMYALGKKLFQAGLGIVCSTTTKIYSPKLEDSPLFGIFNNLGGIKFPAKPFLITIGKAWDNIEKQAAKDRLWHTQLTTPDCSLPSPLLADSAAYPALYGGKVTGFSIAEIDTFWQQGTLDALLLEADGAAKRPLKAPASKEPVIPSVTGMVIAVLGLQGFGKTLTQEYVWRPEIFSRLAELPYGSIINAESLAKVAMHPAGLFKGSPPDSKKILFLNIAENAALFQVGEKIAQMIFSFTTTVVEKIYIGSAKFPESAKCLNKK